VADAIFSVFFSVFYCWVIANVVLAMFGGCKYGSNLIIFGGFQKN